MRKFHIGVSIIVLATQCIQPIDPETIGFEDLLVVEGLITDQMTNQKVVLTRTLPLGSVDSTIRYELNAEVYLMDEELGRIDFMELDSGQYYSVDAYAARSDVNIQLFIETADGDTYESDPVSLVATPPMDSIYAEFTSNNVPGDEFGGDFRFYIDALSNPNDNVFYRWKWSTTYQLKVPNPSKWLWTGGNTFVFRELGSENNDLQVEVCWNTEPNDRILIQELNVPSTGVERLLITQFNSSTRKMLQGYSIEVKQYAMSPTSFQYWNEIAQITLEQGSLADQQLGTITGNIKSTSNSGEPVLGIFEAAQEVSIRRQFDPLEFGSQGYRREQSFIADCSDIEPVESSVDEIGITMERLGPGWALAFFITGGGAFYYPVKCADCTVYGSNQQPDFWE